MDEITPKRVALMSIRPEFADAILSGKKTVEFRKRPVSHDVSHVLIYATLPVASLLGWFVIDGQATTSPPQLWTQFKDVAGISKERFFEYYAQRVSGTGIMVGPMAKFDQPIPLTELGTALRPPQSFQYLTTEQNKMFVQMTARPTSIADN